MRPGDSFDSRCYRLWLRLYPEAFRREFGREMLQDFVLELDEHRQRDDRRALWAFRRHVLLDGLVSLAKQWIHTGWPVFASAALVVPVLAVMSMGNLWKRTRFDLPADSPNVDVLGLVLMATVSVVVIAATIIVTIWFTSPHLRRRARSRHAARP